MSWLIIFAIIVVNSMFVIAEVALLTSRQVRLERMVQNGSKGANIAISLTKTPERFLSVIQIGITLMNILLGLYSGATVGDTLVHWLDEVPSLQEYSYEISNGVMVLIITYITVLGEIIPKRIAMLSPEKLASILSYGMLFLMKIAAPLVNSLIFSTKLVMRILRVKETSEPITVEELKIFINQAEHSGMVDKTERDMIRRLVHLSDITVGAIMTPRSKIIYLNTKDSDEENLRKVSMYPFNFFPVIDGDSSNILGIVSVKTILNLKMQGKELLLRSRVRPALYMPENARLTKLIEILRAKQIRIAIVIDEYGGIEGLVTFNDIVKTFVGDIATMVDGSKPMLTGTSGGGYSVAGNVPVEEIMEVLGLHSLPGDEEEDYRTLASFIMKQLNKIPAKGESFIAMGWKFEVTNMDNFRVDKVLITPHEDG
ncbi:MAG: HlyC/CorC family transporter [Proteobacteria bacterium]|nr:HlyC/CorC family transporter [Pseudomonadota bacterium]